MVIFFKMLYFHSFYFSANFSEINRSHHLQKLHLPMIFYFRSEPPTQLPSAQRAKVRFWCCCPFHLIFLLLSTRKWRLILLVRAVHHNDIAFPVNTISQATSLHTQISKKATFRSDLHPSTFCEHLNSLQMELDCWCAHSRSLALGALGGKKMSKSWVGDLLILQSVWIGGSARRSFCSDAASCAHCVFCFGSPFSRSRRRSEGVRGERVRGHSFMLVSSPSRGVSVFHAKSKSVSKCLGAGWDLCSAAVEF